MNISKDPILWPSICNDLLNDFPELAQCHPTNSLSEMAVHLSKAHDLTHSEALETLHDWLWLKAPDGLINRAA